MTKQPLRRITQLYAKLIIDETKKKNPDLEQIREWAEFLYEQSTQLTTPEPKQLKPYQFEKGVCKGITGTVVIDGKKIPRVSLCWKELVEKKKKEAKS